MRKSTARFPIVLGCFLCLMIVSTDAWSQECSPEGNWMTIIQRRKVSMRIGMHIETTAGGYKGYMTSPDQSTDQYALDNVIWKDDSLKAECKKVGLIFMAVMNAGCDSLNGSWVQGVTLEMKLWRVDELPLMSRPQEPFPPFPYIREEVTFENSKEKITLAGTISYPKGDGPFPAVILISGSGPQNRDEELLGHKPFLVIADYLTLRGFAVLRFDDRGFGKSGGDFSKATSFDFATDVEAAFDFLKKHPAVNPEQIGLIGHSEGGMIAPVVAAGNKKVAFVVLLAGPGTTGKQILISQTELIGRADSADENVLQVNLRIAKLTYEIIEKEKDAEAIAVQIRAMIKTETENFTSEQKKAAGLTLIGINAMIMSITTDWFTTFVRFNPEPWLKKVRCPLLALNGEKDLQVPSKENLPAIENALKNGKCKNFKVQEMPGLNHLFQHCTTGSPNEYFSIPETISPEVLKIMGDWISEITKDY